MPDEEGKYQCPHCGSRKNRFFSTDSDMGYSEPWNVYQCINCKRYFDEPLKGETGLSRA